MYFKNIREKWSNSYVSRFLNKIFYFNVKNNKEKYRTCIWCHNIYPYDTLNPPIKQKNNRYKTNYCSKICYVLSVEQKFQAFKANNHCKRHPLEKKTYRNSCWGCYKKNVLKNNKIPKLKGTFILRYWYGFKIVPTFIKGEKANRIAFDQYLADNNYKWFVYIKLYKDTKGNIKPLVVGKSGSVKVNSTGCDLSFSTVLEDGPARKFIYYNHSKWYEDHILVSKCKNEWQAFKFERKITNNFNLFGS